MTRVTLSTIILIVAVIILAMVLDQQTGDTGVRDFTSANETDVSIEDLNAPKSVSTDTSQTPSPVARHETDTLAADDSDGPSWPDGIEDLFLDHFATQNDFEFTSISSVECDSHNCEIVFTGNDPNPQFVDEYSDLLSSLFGEPLRVTQGSLKTREIAAGAREYVLNVSNIQYVPESEPETESE